MTNQRQGLRAEPGQSPKGGIRRGFLEAALAAFPIEVRGAFQELGSGLLETSFVLYRKLRKRAEPKAVLAAIALDLDSLEGFARLAGGGAEPAVGLIAGRTARRLRRLARQLRAELAATEGGP